MDILLINPDKLNSEQVTEHLGIASLKAYASSQGFVADTLDLAHEPFTEQQCVRHIIRLNPRCVGFSLLDATREKGLSLISKLRRAGYAGSVITGGYFPTFSSYELLRDFSEIDFVVRGEGELTLVELLQYLIDGKGKLANIKGLSFRKDGESLENPARELINDLDILPPVDRKYAGKVLQKNGSLRLFGTRGCWGQCTFCDIIGLYATSKGKSWRRRSAKNLADEIEHLVLKFNTSHFIFNDDQFLVKGPKAVEFVEAFAAELEQRNLTITFELMCRADTVRNNVMIRLKSVGLQRVFLGLESFDEKQLQRFRKRISVRQNLKAVITLYRLKLDVIASVILADAHTTLWDLLKQFVVIFELKRKYFNSSRCQISVNKKLEIYRGSAVYQDYKRAGLLSKDDYLDGCDFNLKFLTGLRLKMLTAEENLARFIFKPGTFIKQLINKFHWRNLALKQSSFLL